MFGHLKSNEPNELGFRNQSPLDCTFCFKSPSSNPSTVQGAYLRANGRMRVLLTRITRTPPFVQGEAALVMTSISWDMLGYNPYNLWHLWFYNNRGTWG